MSDIQEEQKRLYKRAEDNDIKLLKEELEELREDNYVYHQLMKMENEREYRSKFLKEFQEEFGKNVFLDYDEIYKRYDKLKKENKRLKEQCDKYEEEHKTTFEEWKKDIKTNKKAIRQIEIILEIALEQDSENVNLIDRLRYFLNILQGVDKE